MELHLSAEREAQLNEYAQRHGQDPATALDEVLAAALTAECADFQEACEGLSLGYADSLSGLVRPLKESLKAWRDQRVLLG